MEAFEQFVALALEADGFVVSSSVKFPVQRLTGKAAYKELQTHGYEVDLIGARAGRLVLATVKSFFGSRGVAAEDVMGTSKRIKQNKLYALLNDPVVRRGVVRGAAKAYGYQMRQVELRLYAGKFAAPSHGTHEAKIRAWCKKQRVGQGSIGVFGATDVVNDVRRLAANKQYRDNPVLATMKVLAAAGALSDISFT